MRILFISDYAISKSLIRWRKGEYPGHHLWGITHLPQYGIEVKIIPDNRQKYLAKRSRFLFNLVRQLQIVFSAKDYDFIYSASQQNTLFLAVLSSLKLFKKPIICTVHHGWSNSESVLSKLFIKLVINGHHCFICLNNKAITRIKQLGDENVEEKLHLIEWGVDLNFYPSTKTNSELSEMPIIISAGKMRRDYNTLVHAFENVNGTLKIYCTKASAPTVVESNSRIEVKYQGNRPHVIKYKDLLTEYQKAYAVAIPIIDTPKLTGLTSLFDAMAMAKPVIMTRNPGIDVDIEKEGIGIWVKAGDSKGWRKAITYLLENPKIASQMGERSRSLCEKKYNLDRFSFDLANILQDVFNSVENRN